MILNKIPRAQLYLSTKDIFKSITKTIFKKSSYGLKVKKFEKAFGEYQGNKNYIVLPFARTALYYTLKAYNFPKDSEIITTSITILDIINMIICSGNIPVFVDINKDFCMDINKLKNKITPKTKAILVTHLFGNPTNMKEIMKIAKKNNLKVIEDVSQSMGARFDNKLMGNFGDVAIFSLSSFKTLSTFYGGLLITKDKKILNKIKIYNLNNPLPSKSFLLNFMFKNLILSLATNKIIFSLFTYNVIKILNSIHPSIVPYLQKDNKEKSIYKEIPEKFEVKFTDLQAELGLKYLKKLDITNKKRKEICEKILNKKIEGTCWRLPYLSKNYKTLMKSLFNNYIDCSQPLLSLCNRETVFEDYFSPCPNAKYLFENMFLIPNDPKLNEKQVEHISKIIKDL